MVLVTKTTFYFSLQRFTQKNIKKFLEKKYSWKKLLLSVFRLFTVKLPPLK